jgi:hypothetical protein
VLGEVSAQDCRDRNGPPPLATLRLYRAFLLVPGSLDPDDAFGEVHVIPSQSTELAPTKPAVEGSSPQGTVEDRKRVQQFLCGTDLLLDQRLDLLAAFANSRPEFQDYLLDSAKAAGAVGKLGQTAKASKLSKLDSEIAEVRKENNSRRIAAAKAEAEARIKAELAGLEQELAAETA